MTGERIRHRNVFRGASRAAGSAAALVAPALLLGVTTLALACGGGEERVRRIDLPRTPSSTPAAASPGSSEGTALAAGGEASPAPPAGAETEATGLETDIGEPSAEPGAEAQAEEKAADQPSVPDRD